MRRGNYGTIAISLIEYGLTANICKSLMFRIILQLDGLRLLWSLLKSSDEEVRMRKNYITKPVYMLKIILDIIVVKLGDRKWCCSSCMCLCLS